MVLEISATPYIFTFKLWDWGRLGLDGKPRPIHLDHGQANIQWDRTTDWVRAKPDQPSRTDRVTATAGARSAPGCTSSSSSRPAATGSRGPCRTTRAATRERLNLVEGDEAIVESPTGAFEPFVVHYAETFIVPAAVGPYTIRPARSGARAASVRRSRLTSASPDRHPRHIRHGPPRRAPKISRYLPRFRRTLTLRARWIECLSRRRQHPGGEIRQ